MSRRFLMRRILDKIEIGKKRIRKKFLFLPKTIKNEWRWLEYAEFEEEFIAVGRRMSLSCGGGYYDVYEWVLTKWIN